MNNVQQHQHSEQEQEHQALLLEAMLFGKT
jgi:hypothetical protein